MAIIENSRGVQTIVTGGEDTKAKVWQKQKGQWNPTELTDKNTKLTDGEHTAHDDSVHSVAIIENSRGVQTVVTGGEDTKAKVWQIRDGQWIPTVLNNLDNTRHKSYVVTSVAIIENSRGVQTIVTGGYHKAKVWQIRDGKWTPTVLKDSIVVF